jgi:hypothetical protein
MDVLAVVGLIFLAGRIAERRGRSFSIWAWIAAIIGPFALPLLFLFPNLHRRNRIVLEGTEDETLIGYLTTTWRP